MRKFWQFGYDISLSNMHDLVEGLSDSSIWCSCITKFRPGLKAGATAENLSLIKMVGFEEEVLRQQEKKGGWICWRVVTFNYFLMVFFERLLSWEAQFMFA